MTAVLHRPVPWWQQPALIYPFGMIAVLMAALSVELSVFAFQTASDRTAYDSAPVCSSTADITNCRFQGVVRVVSTWRDKQGYRNVEVAFVELGGLKAFGELAQGSAPEWPRWQPEDQLEAELWRGKLTFVQGARTLRNPDLLVGNFIPAAYIVSPIALTLLAVVALWTVAYRRAARLRTGQDAAAG